MPARFQIQSFGANRRGSLDAVPHDKTTPQDLGFTNVNADAAAGVAPPIMFTTSFNLGPSPQGPTTFANTTFQWEDNVSWTKGNHQLKFGGDFRRACRRRCAPIFLGRVRSWESVRV